MRKTWIDNCKAYIEAAKPGHLKHRMLDILYEAVHADGGEFACLGTFMPEWVARLEDHQIRTQVDLREIKRFLRVIASGARLVMREFARLKEVSEGEARELRQLSIVQFTEHRLLPKTAPRKPKGKADPNNAPKDSIWGPTDRSIDCRLEWSGRLQCALIMDSLSDGLTGTGNRDHQTLIPGALPPVEAVRTVRACRPSAKGSTPFFPWTGLNWFNPPIAPSLGGHSLTNSSVCSSAMRPLPTHPVSRSFVTKLQIAPVLGGKPTAHPGAPYRRHMTRTMYRP